LAAAEERVDECAGDRSGAGVNGHAGGFIDDDDVVVFVENVERDGFGLGDDGRALGRFESDFFCAANVLRAFSCGSAIDEDEAGFDEFLNAGAGEFGAAGGDKAVETRAGVFRRSKEFAVCGWRGRWHGEIVAARRRGGPHPPVFCKCCF